MREKRTALDPQARSIFSHGLFEQFLKTDFLNNNKCQSIGLYKPFDAEIDPVYILNYYWEKNKNCYLPVIPSASHQNNKILQFGLYQKKTLLAPNRFNILEPAEQENLISAQHLDLIFLPLTAFDAKGYRLGMGQGYYDRTLAAVFSSKIVLIGLGYSFQEIPVIKPSHWDVKLDGILTEQKFYLCT